MQDSECGLMATLRRVLKITRIRISEHLIVRIICGALISELFFSSLPILAQTSIKETASTCNAAVELVKALAWPLITIVAALVYRTQIGRFVQAVGERATRFSLFKVEVELTSASKPVFTPLLEDIQRAPSSAQVSDSSRAMIAQVQDSAQADYALIDIGQGGEWLTTRLFIGALMLERMRGLRCLVFTEQSQLTDRRFVALASPSQIRWSLAQRFPWLEVAFARSYAEKQPYIGIDLLPDLNLVTVQTELITSKTGALNPFMARQLVGRFIDLVQSQPLAGPQSVPQIGSRDEWVKLESGNLERSAWVTRQLLRELLPDDAFNAWADESRDQPRIKRTQFVLGIREANFVALLSGDRAFLRLIDRRTLLEEVASRIEQ